MNRPSRRLPERWFWFAYERATGRRIVAELARLEREQYLPAPELEALQMERLQALLAHVAAHVPYYRDLFRQIGLAPGDIRTLQDFAQLPVLERETVRLQGDRMLADGLRRASLESTETSGTTGMPITVYHDPPATNAGVARYWRAMRAWGYRPGDRMLRIVAPSESARWKVSLRDWVQKTLMRDWRWYVQRGGREELSRLANALRRWQPKFFRSFLAILNLLAAYLRHRGERLHVPRVVSGAQLMMDEERRALLDSVGDEVFDYYSSDEALGIAFECEAHEGLHVNSESLVLEAVVQGRAAQPGELGEVFVTVLTNQAMPLIRYRLGDTATPVGKPCPCGRTLPRIRMTHGRVLDIISAPGGRFVTPGVFFRVFQAVGEFKVAQFQVVQETLDRLRLRVVRGPDYSTATEAALSTAIRREMGDDVVLDFEYVEDIPLGPCGKLRVTQSRVPVRFE